MFKDTNPIYGKPDFSFKKVFNENQRLTKLDTSNGRSFGKLLALAASTDLTVNTAGGVASTAATSATAGVVGALSRSGTAAQAAGTLTAFYGAEATSLSETLAKTIIFYLYYLSVVDNTTNPVVI